jgi:hypothetical protein
LFMEMGRLLSLIYELLRAMKPLCLYVFSSSDSTQTRFQRDTRSGTMVFNDTIVQFASRCFVIKL